MPEDTEKLFSLRLRSSETPATSGNEPPDKLPVSNLPWEATSLATIVNRETWNLACEHGLKLPVETRLCVSFRESYTVSLRIDRSRQSVLVLGNNGPARGTLLSRDDDFSSPVCTVRLVAGAGSQPSMFSGLESPGDARGRLQRQTCPQKCKYRSANQSDWSHSLECSSFTGAYSEP